MLIKHLAFLLFSLCVLLTGCSTQQNTAVSRRWQSFVTRYNVFYNATVAYQEGEEAQRTGLREDFTRRLPVFAVGYPKQVGLGKTHFERAVTKCEKAIQLHSIKRKPAVKVGSNTSPKLKAYLSRKEFNPYLKNAWLLMGKAQFQQGDFLAAASTFAHLTRFYAAEPEVVAEARIWLIRCDVALGWLYDAEDVAQRLARERLPKRLENERDRSLADLLLARNNTAEALPYLERAARHGKNSFEKARLHYLLAQVLLERGEKQAANRAIERCLSQSPGYELAFQARMLQTETVTTAQGTQKMLARLKRMLRDANNKDYLDRIYYAVGNIHLAARDTLHALEAYEIGRVRATQSTPEKGVLLRRLGDLYWQRQRFDKAQPCYTEAIGLLDQQSEGYAELLRRSEVLDHLVPYTQVVFEQDSLLALARMPEAARFAVIDNAIALLKKQEENDRRNRSDSLRRARSEAGGDYAENAPTAPTAPQRPTTDKSWYFYNTTAVQQGKQAFARQWGNRRNEDDWRRANHSLLADNKAEGYDYAAEDSLKALVNARRDSLSAKGLSGDALETALRDYAAQLSGDAAAAPADTTGGADKKGKAELDPHTRAYYLAQIPLTPEAKQAAHQLLRDALFGAGVVEHEELGDYPLAERTLRRLVRDYPDFDKLPEAYYQLFLLARRGGKTETANKYRALMARSYPQHLLTRTITDPDFERNARYGRELEDSLYAATYAAYINGHNEEVARNFARSTATYPEGLNRPKFLLVNALSRIGTAPRDTLIAEFTTLAKDFPKSDVAEMAAMMAKGLQEGRTPAGEKFRPGSLWARRMEETTAENAAEGDKRTLSPERDVPFVFVVAYPADSLPDDKILFELARFNFSRFVSRGLDINKERLGALTLFRVDGFASFADVHHYAQTLSGTTALRQLLKGARTLLISKDNLKLLGSVVSFDDYRQFYDKHFAPQKIKSELPTEYAPEDELPKQIYEDELPDNKSTSSPANRQTETKDDEYEYEE